MTKAEALKQRKELLKLIEQWTRAEAIARYGRFDNLEFAQYAVIQIEKADEIRRLIFGTDNIVVLGIRWGILEQREKEEKRREKKRSKSDA